MENLKVLVIMEEKEVDLCLVCCSTVKNERDCHQNNNNGKELLSSNLNVFYLLRNVFQVSGIQLKYNLINYGSPLEWIKLCDKCTELARQGEELHRKLKQIERELSFVEKLIRDKVRLSINCENERKLVEEEATIGDLTKKSDQVWKRIRNHVTNNGNWLKRNLLEEVTLTFPFSDGDKLANYLLTQRASTTTTNPAAILPTHLEHSKQNGEDGGPNLSEELEGGGGVEVDVKEEVEDEEEMEVDGGRDRNWEPDDEDVDQDEETATPPPPPLKTMKIGKTSYLKHGKLIITQEGKYKCRHCDLVFNSASGMYGHEGEKHCKSAGTLICDICGKAFNSPAYLQHHKRYRHKLKADGTPILEGRRCPSLLEREHICDKCGKSFTRSTLLTNHVRFVHEKRFTFKCPCCGMEKTCRSALNKHLLALHPEDPSSKRLIKEEGLNLCKCPVVGCRLPFLSEQSVKGHLRKKHGKVVAVADNDGLDLSCAGADADAGVLLKEPPMKIPCEICGKVYTTKSSLRFHLKIHENQGKGVQFSCESCGKGFYTGATLKGHVKWVHLRVKQEKKKNGVEVSSCETCGKRFARRSSLKKHLQLHEIGDRKDFSCDKCGRRFTMKRYLMAHKRNTGCGGRRQ